MAKPLRGGKIGAAGAGGLFGYSMPQKSVIGADDPAFTVSVNTFKDNRIDEESIRQFGKYTDAMQDMIKETGVDVEINIPKYEASSDRQLAYANSLAEKAVYAEVNKMLSNVNKAKGTDVLKNYAKERGIEATAQGFAEYKMKNGSLMKTVLEAKTASEVIDKLKNNKAIMNLPNTWKSGLSSTTKSTLEK